MQFNEFSELTTFLYAEYDKLKDNFDIKHSSQKFVKFVEDTLQNYIGLYNKPLYVKAKRELSIQIAIDTMPHGFIWKIFHPTLWSLVKERLNIKKEKKSKPKRKKSEEKTTLYPDVVKPFDVPQPTDFDSFD